MRRLVLTGSVLTLAVLPLALSAQTWRTFEVARQARDANPLSVHVSYGAGRVEIQPAVDRALYDIHLRYDVERGDPVYRYNATERHLEVGVRQRSNLRTPGKYKGHELRLDLARGVPLNLKLDIGAAEGDVDLSGLSVATLTINGGATDTRVRFDAPNPVRLTEMNVHAGAASVKLHGLGNANIERMEATVGVGTLELDFGGDWRADTHLSVNSALGSVQVTVPSNVGVRVEKSTFLHAFDAPGLQKRDGYWFSDNWDTATYKLYVRSTGALGAFEINRQ
jgi:hypothetical protein